MTRPILYLSLAVLLVSILSSPIEGVQAAEQYHVASFTSEQLHHGSKQTDDLLTDILTTTGILSIRIPLEYQAGSDDSLSSSSHNSDVLSGLCGCQNNLGSRIQGGEEFLLDDGITLRKTIATATTGIDRPIPLPRGDIVRECGVETYHELERARRHVSEAVSSVFLPALDRLIAAEVASTAGSSSSHNLLDRTNGLSYQSVTSIVKDAVNLEHFHAYSKHDRTDTRTHESDPVTDYALDWHTDGGLFLAFLPAKVCATHDTNPNIRDDHSFYIQHPNSNQELQAIFPRTTTSNNKEITVAIMLGAGSEQWLQTPDSLPLRATRHAVKMTTNDVRVWYGMMHLVPTDAIVKSDPHHPVTFAEWRKASSPVHHTDSEHALSADALGAHDKSSSVYRRGLQGLHDHVESQKDCTSSEFYCWISCLSVPEDGQSVKEHLDKGQSLYCLEQSVLDDTQDIQQAVDACTDGSTGVAGSKANLQCGNTWFNTTTGLQSYTDGLNKKVTNIMNTDSLGPSSSPSIAPIIAPTLAPVGNGDANNYSFLGFAFATSLLLILQLLL